jgi:hypothetical protein
MTHEGVSVLLQLEQPHIYPPFLVDGEAPHPPLCVPKSSTGNTNADTNLTYDSKFCVAVSGFKPSGSLSAKIYGTPYSTPTLHIFGKTDIIVIEERTKDLLDLSQNKRVEDHVGG